MNFNKVRKEIEHLKKLLQIKPGCSLEELIKKIEDFYEIEIFLEAANLPNCTSGFCTIVKGAYLVQYDKNLNKRERQLIIGHELGHIINKDINHQISDNNQIVCRKIAGGDSTQEKKAELIGFFLTVDLAIDEYEATTSQWYGLQK